MTKVYSGTWTDDLDTVVHWTWLAIRLGVRLAEEEALFKLTMNARQVRAAELERRRPHLVNNTLH